MNVLVCEHCGEKHPEGDLCGCRRQAVLEELKGQAVRYTVDGPVPRREGAGIHPLVAGLLAGRGIDGDLETFLDAPVGGILNEKMKGQQEAARRIGQAVEAGEPITIYGDYDADGVTSTALGVGLLERLGARVDFYINDRFAEGFGIGVPGVEAIHRRGTRLIVTCDNGIAGVQAIRRARELGMDVVVTDHHEPGESLPDCVVVDPKQPGCSYPNKEITGVGVLFKVLRDVCADRGLEKLPLRELDLVALGTVADVAPLTGENRVFVKNGLKLMNWDRARPGIRAFKEVAGIQEVKSYHLGFVLGPMINAEGRLDGSPEVAVRLLTTTSMEEATGAARQLQAANKRRQELLEGQYELAESLLEPQKDLFFLADGRFHEGIVGLIASRLKENFGRPAIVLGRDGQGRYKGSGRSVPGIHMKELLDKMSGLMEGYGGHAMACGLTVAEENLVVLKNMLETEVKKKMAGRPPGREVPVDGVLGWEDLDMALARGLERLEPFGQGFPRPKFLVEGFVPDRLGYSKDGKHTRMDKEKVTCWRFGERIEEDGPFRLVGYPDVNEFRGTVSLQFKVEDCRPERVEPEEREETYETDDSRGGNPGAGPSGP